MSLLPPGSVRFDANQIKTVTRYVASQIISLVSLRKREKHAELLDKPFINKGRPIDERLIERRPDGRYPRLDDFRYLWKERLVGGDRACVLIGRIRSSTVENIGQIAESYWVKVDFVCAVPDLAGQTWFFQFAARWDYKIPTADQARVRQQFGIKRDWVDTPSPLLLPYTSAWLRPADEATVPALMIRRQVSEPFWAIAEDEPDYDRNLQHRSALSEILKSAAVSKLRSAPLVWTLAVEK